MTNSKNTKTRSMLVAMNGDFGSVAKRFIADTSAFNDAVANKLAQSGDIPSKIVSERKESGKP